MLQPADAIGIPRRRLSHPCNPHLQRVPTNGRYLNQSQLWERFRPGQPLPKELGASRDYNVDMVPKFMMANGKLVRTLVSSLFLFMPACQPAAALPLRPRSPLGTVAVSQLSLSLLLFGCKDLRRAAQMHTADHRIMLLGSPRPQVRTLILTDVTKYLDFKGVDGSYVLNGGKVYKVRGGARHRILNEVKPAGPHPEQAAAMC